MKTILTIAAFSLALPAMAVAGEHDRTASPVQWVPPPASDGFSYPDCFCTDSSGQRVEQGQTACLRVDGREFIARCAMSLNSPAWRKVQDECGPIS